MRKLPQIKLDYIEGYAQPLASGYDALTETFKMLIPPDVETRLDAAKMKAQELSNTGKEKHSIMFGGQDMQISSMGATGGVSWWLSCPEFHILIRRGGKEWNVSVKYEAVGMWCYGMDKVRTQARKVLLNELQVGCDDIAAEDEKNWCTVSRADFAFDLYSPRFTEEMRPAILENILCNSKMKKQIEFNHSAWGRGCRLETITIGRIDNLQVQVYDKGREIREKSGKEWMVRLWKRDGFEPEDEKHIEHVWRVEIRMGKTFLKNRGVIHFDDMEALLPELLAEALFTRRLVSEPRKIGGDTNKARWDLHPLWSEAYGQSFGAVQFVPLGYLSSASKEEKKEQMNRSIAGIMRSRAVLEDNDNQYDWKNAHNVAMEAFTAIEDDPEHEKKVQRSQERYKHLGQSE